MDYHVVHESDWKIFLETMNRLTHQGWKVEGGIAVVVHLDSFHYYQAVTRDIREGGRDSEE
jgi:hypothetical protein